MHSGGCKRDPLNERIIKGDILLATNFFFSGKGKGKRLLGFQLFEEF